MGALLRMADGELFRDHCCSSIAQYSQMYFGYSKTLTDDLIRVGRALGALPLCVAAFESGEICWSSLKEIVRVAKPHSEKDWIEFARGRSSHDVGLEVDAAVEDDRPTPRKNPYGLPGVKLRMGFEFAPQEYDVVEKALWKAACEIQGPLGGKRPSPEAALLYVAQRILETDSVAGERVEKEGAPATIVYRHCPACRISHVILKRGPMEVPPEVIERMEAEADKVVITPEEELGPEAAEALRARAARAREAEPGAAGEAGPAAGEAVSAGAEAVAEAAQLEAGPVPGSSGTQGTASLQDEGAGRKAEGAMAEAAGTASRGGGTVAKAERDKPNTPALTRRVLLRDGGVCANPFCGRRRGLSAHHVIWRSKGGKTEIWNETSLCRPCHALVHVGLLRITSTEIGEVRFEPRADRSRLDLAALKEKVSAAPIVAVAIPDPRGGLVPARVGPAPAGTPDAPAGAGARCLPGGSAGAPACGCATGAPGAAAVAVDPASAGFPLPGGPGGTAEAGIPPSGLSAARGYLDPVRLGGSRAAQAPTKAWKDPVLEPLVRALRSLGYRVDEARERVWEAAEHFQRLGQAATEEQILKRALMHRRLREKMDAREAAKAAALAATT